jgi:hypothetical protein
MELELHSQSTYQEVLYSKTEQLYKAVPWLRRLVAGL